MNDNDRTGHYKCFDSAFYRIVGRLTGYEVLETPADIRMFGAMCILLSILLAPIIYLCTWLIGLIGISNLENNPLGYALFFMIILSPYTFFAGLDCLITGEIGAKNSGSCLTGIIGIMGAVFLIVSIIVSYGYYDYYNRVYLPSIAGQLELAREIDMIEGASPGDAEARSADYLRTLRDPSQQKDPFWKMVAEDKLATYRSMQRAPWICAALWLTTLILYVAFYGLKLSSKPTDTNVSDQAGESTS